MPEKTSPAKPARAKTSRPAPTKAPAATPEKSVPGERIAKVLSRAGIASRREAERLIEAGEVKVNGKIVTSPALNVTAKDKITVSGQPVGAPEPARLWIYHKPEGLVTSASDEKGRDTVFDHLPEDMPRVMSVGRLDLNSEGLLLLTNDGELKRRLELPSTGWLRKYRVRVKGNPTDPDLEPLRKGITIEGERFQPMEVALDRHQGSNAWLTVGLREGKNREIRRAMTEIGLTVNRLIRVSYGPFRLNELKPGEVEEVRARVLRDQLGTLMPDDPDGARPSRPAAPAKAGAEGGSAAKRTVTRSARSSREEDWDAEPKRGPRGERPAGPARRPFGKSGDRTADRATEGPAHKTTRKPFDGKRQSDGPKGARDDGPASGRVTSAKGRAGLKSLSRDWAEATEPKSGPKSGQKSGPHSGPHSGARKSTAKPAPSRRGSAEGPSSSPRPPRKPR